MKNLNVFLSTFLCVAAACPVAAFTLVENGTPKATIVVPAAALSPAKDDVTAQKINVAAHDLQDYVKKMSGAVLPLVADNASPVGALVLVGPSRLTDTMKLNIPSGLTAERKEEGFLIQSSDDHLVLAGNDAGPYHGTEYATYELLNRLGMRWYMPGPFGEVIPSHPTLAVPAMTVREKPDFIQRNWWDTATPEMAAMELRWKIRNKMNPDNMFQIPADGSVTNFMVPPEQAKTHPELFAQNADGSANTTLPNLTNPATVKIAADMIKVYFRAHPEANSVGLAPADGIPRDYSPETLKLNQGFTQMGGRDGVPDELSGSEEWFAWINAVVREVNKDFPDHIVTTNGYANRSLMPLGLKIDPHVSIMFAAIWSDTLHALDNPKSWQMRRQGELLRDFTKANDKVWIYGYDYIMLASGLTPVPGTHKLAHDFPLLKKWGVVGFINESRIVTMERGIATKYLNARLMWNANGDVKALLDDYYTQWYGAAAKPARAFWEALEDTMENTPLLGHEDRFMPFVYTPQLLTELEKDVTAAEALASTPTEKIHVRVDRLTLEHLQEYMAMSHADLTGDYAEAARQGKLMLATRVKLAAIDRFFTAPSETFKNGTIDLTSGIYYWSIAERIKYYQKLANQMSGKTGTLVSLLPQRAAFTLDPEDRGRFEGWSRPDWDISGWTSVTVAEPFYTQGPRDHPYMDEHGYPYMGAMWYQFKVNVPAIAPGRDVKLYIPIIETEGWVWVNGTYVGHREYMGAYNRPIDMDVKVTDALRPGPNVITIRVSTSLNSVACADGLLSRSFLYSPPEAPQVPTPPTAHLATWLEADQGVVAGADGSVSSWADQSSQHHDASQAKPADQPKLAANAINGKPALSFNGTTSYLSMAKALDLTSGLSIFIVAKNEARKNSNGLLQIGNTPDILYSNETRFEAFWNTGSQDGGSGQLYTSVNRGTYPADYGQTTGDNMLPRLNDFYIYNYNAGDEGTTLLVDKVLQDSSTGTLVPTGAGFGTLGVGGAYGGPTGLHGDIAEVIIYDAILSPIDQDTVYRYLDQKYRGKK